jgi:AraC-like DNA-binding protein
VRTLFRGEGWWINDVVCCRGPHDRPFEEQHECVTIAIVTAGTFQYRASGGSARRVMMTPGSVLLGNPGQYYECGHEHAVGDRCISFHYSPEYFVSITADSAADDRRRRFTLLRLPPVRMLSRVVADAHAALAGSADQSWEELSVRVAAQALRLAADEAPPQGAVSAAAIARVTRTVRTIERQSEASLTLTDLARGANLSPFHFLRTFQHVIGVTPHQYLMRTRLRRVAACLAAEPTKVVDIALDCGFGDLSNMNRAFRAEFGLSPRLYRRSRSLPPGGITREPGVCPRYQAGDKEGDH